MIRIVLGNQLYGKQWAAVATYYEVLAMSVWHLERLDGNDAFGAVSYIKEVGQR